MDHSSNLPDPVALSSAEAEYNEGCIAFMAASHLRMLLCELEECKNLLCNLLPCILTVKVPYPWASHIEIQSTLIIS
jgi:hypothetical protein